MSLNSKKTYPFAGIVVLAAGGSTRLGEPKQLLKFRGETLLKRAVRAACSAGAAHTVVVLDKENSGEMRNELTAFDAATALNENSENGMGSSIAAGVEEMLRAAPAVACVVLMVCDQPFVDEVSISKLLEKFTESGAPIAASEYNGTFGVPAVFGKEFFEDLMNLTGDTGAKSLIKKFASKAVFVPLFRGEFDIDRPEDYRQLLDEDFFG